MLNVKTLLVVLTAASAIGSVAGPVMAQTAPGAVPSYATQDQQIHGRVVSFDGAYGLRVRDDHGYVDNVRLHEGTIINPTGITLASGMVISVDGYNSSSSFVANEIDTPYTFYSGVPYYLGHPWYYYGPTASLSFYFGHTGWWHGAYAPAPVFINHGVYVYHHPAPYRGGAWRGHDYVAAPQHGGYVSRAGIPHGTAVHGGFQHGAPAHGGFQHAGGARGAGSRHH